MSEPPPPTRPEPSRVVTRILRLLIYGLIGCVFLALFEGDVTLLFDFIFTLCLGWLKYLAQVVPKIRFNVETALCFVVALLLATIGLHRILRRWRGARGDGERWRAGWTLRITAMLLLLFATSIAATGFVHQVGWLFKADVVGENASLGRITDAMNNVKQVMNAIRMYSNEYEDSLPKSLEELMPKYSTFRQILFVRLEQTEPPERILYFPGYKATDPEDTIIVAAPRAFNGQRVIGLNNSSVKRIDETEFQSRMQRQFGGKVPPSIARAIQAR